MSHPAPPAVAFGAEDESHLKLLSIFYYVLAALGALALLMAVGITVLLFGYLGAGGAGHDGSVATGDLTVLIVVMALSVALSLASGILQFMTARRLSQRRGRGLCQFTAAITCLSFPLGTLLGVFTFIVLARPQVRAAFGD
ncbi:hypothetical protein RDV84_00685 [Lysobacter yananisis]|uniref:Uncharacterized protein n=1 Tax=Lysobacter yananisis TaxID=1003114 RepID=A0ABY9PC24_9GAMM|nr:hypothetical protein [Lysobacter yananisis]WMT03402.1 hypothetical protein RDV84_00685 [Lysobacter yananisis]